MVGNVKGARVRITAIERARETVIGFDLGPRSAKTDLIAFGRRGTGISIIAGTDEGFVDAAYFMVTGVIGAGVFIITIIELTGACT